MTQIYKVRIDKQSPYKVLLYDDANNEIDIDHPPMPFNELSKNYFYIDTKHDATYNDTSIPNENKAFSMAYDYYGDRFNQYKFMLVDKDKYENIKNGVYSTLVEHLDLVSNTPNSMLFESFVKDILKINLDDAPFIPIDINQLAPLTTDNQFSLNTTMIPIYTNPTSMLESCPDSAKKKSFYSYLKLYDIRDMSTIFPDGGSSVSFIIDSAPSDASLKNVPNICVLKSITQNKYNIGGYRVPGNADFNDPYYNKFSLLFFGDLQIADYYYTELNLDLISSDFTSLPTTKFSKHPKCEKLLKFSIISLNIFWQTVLTYVQIYVKLSKYPAESGIESLRHWVFTGCTIDNSDKPIFKGKFFKNISDNNTSITYIAYWFLKNHHENANLNTGLYYEDPNMVFQSPNEGEFVVKQRECANLINRVCDHCSISKKAIPREGDGAPTFLMNEINTSFPNKADAIYNEYYKNVVYIGQLLKFSGDISHKTAALMYKMCFSKKPEFKYITFAVSSIDRPLNLSLNMDDIAGIVTNSSYSLMELMGISSMYNYTVKKLQSQKKTIVSFYIPKSELSIFDLLSKHFNTNEKNIKLLNNIYNLINNDFFVDYMDERKKIVYNIVKNLYAYLTQLCLFYMSFFSFNISDLNVFIRNSIPTPSNITTNSYMYNTLGERINGAWFAYYSSENSNSTIEINLASLSESRFFGFKHINALKDLPKINTLVQIGGLNSYSCTDNLDLILIANSYPAIFNIDTTLYQSADDSIIKSKFDKIFTFYKSLLKKRIEEVDINYNENLEFCFFKNLEIYKFLGGLVDNPTENPALLPVAGVAGAAVAAGVAVAAGAAGVAGVAGVAVAAGVVNHNDAIMPNKEVDDYYKKYNTINLSCDESIYQFCLLTNKYLEIIKKKDIYEYLFDSPSVPISYINCDDNYDNLFLYDYEYNGNQNQTKLPNLAGVQQYNSLFQIKTDYIVGSLKKSYFEILPTVISYIVYSKPGYYIYPFIKLSVTPAKILNMGIIKTITASNVNIDSDKITNDVLPYIDTMDGFSEYIDEIISLIEFMNKFGLETPNVINILNGVQCKLIIFFSLLFFNSTCKYSHIKLIHELLHERSSTILYAENYVGLPPRQRGDEYNESFYKNEKGFDITKPNQNMTDDMDINIIGLFTDNPINMNTITLYNITEITGLYYIYKIPLKKSYSNLKENLNKFFLLSSLLTIDTYKNIIIL